MTPEIRKEKIKRLAIWASGGKAPPAHIDLEPTYGCNLLCKFCWQREPSRIDITDYSSAVKEDRLVQIVHEAARIGVLEWQIAGGWEPMVKPHLAMKLMILIKKYHMYGSLTTNGTLFPEGSIEQLIRIGWDKVLFSLEGPDPETHDYLTGVKGSFEKSVHAIREFRDWKKKLGKDTPVYSFHTVLTNKNYTKVAELLKLGKELEVNGVCFEPINVWGEESKKLALSNEQQKEFRHYIREALKLNQELGVYTNAESLLEEHFIEKNQMDIILEKDKKKFISQNGRDEEKISLLNAPCFGPWLNMEIRASGHVVECRLCDDQSSAPLIHNLSLKDVWYGDYFNYRRNKMLNAELPSYCRSCAAGVVLDTRAIREQLVGLPLRSTKRFRWFGHWRKLGR